MLRTLLFVFAAVLTGCSTVEELQFAKDIHAQSMARPTLQVECPDDGCRFKSLSYTDPRDRAQAQLPTNGWDVLKTTVQEAKGLALGVTPWLAVGKVAVEGIRGAGHNVSTQTTDSHNVSTNTDSHDTSAITTINDSHNTDSHAVDNTADPTVVHPQIIYIPAP